MAINQIPRKSIFYHMMACHPHQPRKTPCCIYLGGKLFVDWRWTWYKVWESLSLPLCVLPTGSLQWISLLSVCLLSHCGGRQTCLTPEATSACLPVYVCVSYSILCIDVSLTFFCVRVFLSLSTPLTPTAHVLHAANTAIVRVPQGMLGSLLDKALAACYHGDSVSYFAVQGRYSSSQIKRVSM